MKFDPSEITNPRKTMARREANAESGEPATPAETPAATPTMSQSQFFKQGPRVDPKEKQRRLIQKLRERGDM